MNFERSNALFFSMIALLFLMGFTAHCISQNVDRGDKVFNELVTSVYQMGWADEFMIRNQNLYNNNSALMQSDTNRSMDALTNLILSFSEAGQLISKPLYCKLLAFDMQNDEILNANGTININKLMSSSEYWATKRELTDMLWKEQADYHTLASGIGTLFGDSRAYKYTRTDCQGVDAVPAKIASS